MVNQILSLAGPSGCESPDDMRRIFEMAASYSRPAGSSNEPGVDMGILLDALVCAGLSFRPRRKSGLSGISRVG